MDDSRLPLLVDNVDTIKERKIKSIDARDFALSSSSINSKTVKSISFVVCNFALWAQCVQVIWTSMQIETRWLEKGLNTNNSKTRFLSNSRTCFLQSRHEDGNKHRNLHDQLGRRLRVRILLRNAFPRGETLNCRERERGRERRFRSVDYSVLDIVFGVTEAMAC